MKHVGRVVIVTGGGSGIGKATCRRFAREGAQVVIVDLDPVSALEVEAAVRGEGHQAVAVTADVASEHDVRRMAEGAAEAWGRIDVLVNCAAAFVMKGVDASTEDWARVLGVNVVGAASCVKHAVPHMAPGSAVVNVCSISAVVAQPEFLTYNTSKGALLTMTRCLALDLAGRGIRVNAVSPGTIWTDSNARFIGTHRGLDRAGADADPALGGRHVLGRLGDPEEIAAVITFLASSDASFVTGANVMADGGYTIV